MRSKFGINISYGKAWGARENAVDSLRISQEESFAKLSSYCVLLESNNPGTVTHIDTDSQNHFLYCFVAIGACIRGFHSVMRPVVAIDRTFLKGKYGGVMLISFCKDWE